MVDLALNQTGPLEEFLIKGQMEDTSDCAFVEHLDENRSLRIRGSDAEATVIEAPRSLEELEAFTSAEHLRPVVTRRVVTDLVLAPLQVLAGLVVVLALLLQLSLEAHERSGIAAELPEFLAHPDRVTLWRRLRLSEPFVVAGQASNPPVLFPLGVGRARPYVRFAGLRALPARRQDPLVYSRVLHLAGRTREERIPYDGGEGDDSSPRELVRRRFEEIVTGEPRPVMQRTSVGSVGRSSDAAPRPATFW